MERAATVLLCVCLGACGDDGPDAADLATLAHDMTASPDLAPAADFAGLSAFALPGNETVTITTATAALAGEEYAITLYVPATAGPRPVVAISPGFTQPGLAYTPYAARLASYGIVVLLRDDAGANTGSAGAAEQLTDEIATFLPAQAQKSGGPLEGRIDVGKVGLLGHARGGQVSLIAATGDLQGKIAAVFALDPVDSPDSGTQVRGALPGLGVPSAFLGETLDGTPNNTLGTACAPTADNYQVLYAQAPSPALLLTATGASALSFERADEAAGASLCQVGPADPAHVLDMAVALSTGFFARELLAQPIGADLAGAGADAYVQLGWLTRTQK